MRKVLLIGELSDIVRSLNECIRDDFQVQLCSPELESIQGMVKITKPDLVIVCQIGKADVDRAIFDWFTKQNKKQLKKLPVLVITTKDDWELCKEYCESEQFDKMFRPVVKNDILSKCYEMLSITGPTSFSDMKFTKKRILIIDDSPILLRSIKGILQDFYEVFIATSGEMGLKMIYTKQPDLILLDYEMPGMDGKETYDAIMADEFSKDLPVIFLTNVDERSQIYAVLKSVPAGYILKPPDREKLLTTIREALK